MLSAQALVCCLVVTGVGRTEFVEFTAPWCGACRQMDATVDQLAGVGMPIRKINVDLHRQWAEQMEINSLPTFMVVADGREVARIEGATSYERLAQMFQQSVPRSGPVPRDVVRSQSPQPQTPTNRLGNAVDKLKNLVPRRDAGCRCKGPCQCKVERRAESLHVTPAAVPVGTTLSSMPSDDQNTIQKTLRSTVRLKIEDQEGISYGTGTIVDVHGEEALVLTCGHIFRSSQGGGSISCDLFVDSHPKSISGKLVSYDVRRDVGLVSIQPGVPVKAISIGGAGQVSHEGNRVFAIGCDRGAEPSVIQNRVLAVNRYHGPANLVVGGRPVDGRSGGGLFNQHGVLIGVCNAADQVEDEGLYAALGPIHAELDAVNLGHLYRNQEERIATGADDRTARSVAVSDHEFDKFSHRAGSRGAASPVGNANLLAAVPPQSAASIAPMGMKSPRRGNHPNDNSANTHTANPGSANPDTGFANPDTEVICILRSRGSTGQDSQVMVLEHPSPQLLGQLNKELNSRGPHINTELHSNRNESVSQPPGSPLRR